MNMNYTQLENELHKLENAPHILSKSQLTSQLFYFREWSFGFEFQTSVHCWHRLSQPGTTSSSSFYKIYISVLIGLCLFCDITSWAHRNTESSKKLKHRGFVLAEYFFIFFLLYIIKTFKMFYVRKSHQRTLDDSQRASALVRFYIRVWRNCRSMKATWRTTWW